MGNILIEKTEKLLCLRHSQMEIKVHLSTGTWSLFRWPEGSCLLKDADFRHDHRGQGNWKEPAAKRKVTTSEIDGPWGKGVEVTIRHEPLEGYAPIRQLHLTVFSDHSFLQLDWSIENHRSHPVRIKDVEVIYDGELFPGVRLGRPQYLEGGAGAHPNKVENGEHFECLNNVLLTSRRGGRRLSLVAGGLAYEDFLRGIEVIDGAKLWGGRGQTVIKGEGRNLTLYAEDPIGIEMAPGTTFRPGDTSYLDMITEDPFDALECYGKALATANNANPKAYNFPTLCGWMVSTKNLGEGKPINHSTALIEQAKIAHDHGWMKIAPLGVRLEPDFYCDSDGGNTQQGWWDDEHFEKYGALSEGAPTFEAFCKGLEKWGAIPFTYVQSSMPSNDFALAHPDWMLRGDIADLHRHHRHHRPHIRYDFSHPELQAHLLTVWKRLGKAGLKGIKFDYPETAWNTRGGHSGNMTTTKAYRTLFDICKKGLGEDSYVHERNLGGITHESAPCLDVTAGTVDLQRVWGDASHFEAEMASRMGLRWYKCRQVFHYYPDGKSFVQDGQALEAYRRRSFLTLIGLLGGRIEIGTSVGSMDEGMFNDLSRMYPTLEGKRSFRPMDFLVTPEHPEVYLYEVDSDWVQLMLFNSQEQERKVSTSLSGDPVEEGGLGLESEAQYHAYAFWSQSYLGKFSGKDVLSLQLRGGEAEVISLRKVKEHPQLISTDRHVMQGMLECQNLKWDGEKLSGGVDLPEGMVVKLQFATNGHEAVKAVSGSDLDVDHKADGVIELSLLSEKGERRVFDISFKGSVS
jgi:hypothetical protein